MASRDEYADTSRTGPPKSRESCMVDIDFAPNSLAQEKIDYPNSVGTGNDHAGVTSEVHRRNVRRR